MGLQILGPINRRRLMLATKINQNQPESIKIDLKSTKIIQNQLKHTKIDPKSTKIILNQSKSTKSDQNLFGGLYYILMIITYLTVDGPRHQAHQPS